MQAMGKEETHSLQSRFLGFNLNFHKKHLSKDLFQYQGKVELQSSAETDYLTDNPLRRCPDITNARTELEYNPGITLEEGLYRSLLWDSDNREGEEA